MTLYTETITGGTATEVYGGLTACDAYLLGATGAGAAAYRAFSADDDRKRMLISATRYIDRQRWKGTANAAGGTTLAFPRDGLETVDGDDATDAYQLDLVSRAAFEMAAILAADGEAASNADQSANIKAMGAGSAKLEFFGPTKTSNGTATKLPTALHELIGMWLAGSGSGASVSIAGIATGTDGESSFDDCDGYRRSEAF